MYTESIDINGDRILNVILSKKYLNEIMKSNYENIKFNNTSNVNNTTNTQNIIIQQPVHKVESIPEVPEVPEVSVLVLNDQEVVTDKKYTHDDIISLLNNSYINLYKIYSINETISSLELLIKSYNTELEVLKSADKLYRHELLSTLMKKIN
jgi:hypothetical protein